MLTAMMAVDNIIAGRTDKSNLWEVNTEMEYHEETRVKTSFAKPEVAEAEPTLVTTTGDRQVPRRLTPEELIEAAFAKLDPVAMGAAVGIVAGVSLFVATIVLLLKGGPVVGPTLALLNNVLLGFSVTLPGALIGLVEACLGGFILGYLFAWLRNVGIDAYAWLLQRRAMVESERSLLD